MADNIELLPFLAGAEGRVRVPGSKSLTNRALILSALADGQSSLQGFLESDDTEIMFAALQELGIKIEKTADTCLIFGSGGKFTTGDHNIYVGNSGTSMRFLTALLPFVDGNIRLYGKPAMHERPIEQLLGALRQLGGEVRSEQNNGCPPVLATGRGMLKGGHCTISGTVSSQFLSAILHIGACTEDGITMTILPPLVSAPYLAMTVRFLEYFGIKVDRQSELEYIIPAQKILPVQLAIEGDASGAAHVFSLAVASGGEITIMNFPEKSLQGDAEFLDVLKAFGAEIVFTTAGTTVRMTGDISPLGEINLEHIPDAAMSAVVLAALARGRTKINGLSTLRHKECDRIEALRLGLEKAGAKVSAGDDFLEIFGDPDSLHGAEIETFDDHRVAMSFASLGSKIPGIIICDPQCVTKTFPNFWNIFESCRKNS